MKPDNEHGLLIDPPTGMWPHCICDNACEMPCWQQLGLTDIEPEDPNSCCCKRISEAQDD